MTSTTNTIIKTRYQGPTDTRGSRIIAKCNGRQLSMPYQHELSSSQNHATAAARLASKLKLSGVYMADNSPATGYVFSNADDAKGIESFRVGTADSAIAYSFKVF